MSHIVAVNGLLFQQASISSLLPVALTAESGDVCAQLKRLSDMDI